MTTSAPNPLDPLAPAAPPAAAGPKGGASPAPGGGKWKAALPAVAYVTAILAAGGLGVITARGCAPQGGSAGGAVVAVPPAPEVSVRNSQQPDELPPAAASAASDSPVHEAVRSRAELLDQKKFTANLGGLGRPGEVREVGGDDAAARQQRWELRWPIVPPETYVQQLDFLGVELAAMGGGKDSIDYASKFAQPKAVVRSVPSGTPDERLYFTHRGSSRRAESDRGLLIKAGVEAAGRVVAQFFSKESQQQLAQLEEKQAGKEKLDQIAKTVFGVRPAAAGGFEFYVLEIRWKSGL